MKVAVSSTGKDLNSQVDPRFGRCACFMIVDTDDMTFEAFDNENIALSGGAGIQSATFISSQGVVAVLTGNCGPNALKTFSAGHVDVITGQAGTVREAVDRYKKGILQPSTEATVAEKFGVSETVTGGYGKPQGVGRCMGGSGRGMGGGRGMGMGSGMQTLSEGTAGSGKEDLAALKKQAADLQKQMEVIQEKIKNME